MSNAIIFRSREPYERNSFSLVNNTLVRHTFTAKDAARRRSTFAHRYGYKFGWVVKFK